MKLSSKKWIYKLFKISGLTIVSILLLLFIIPYLFPGSIAPKIKQLVNNQIQGKLEFSEASLSFFKRFPNLTLTLHQINLKGSAPFQNDTLIAASELSFGIDLSSIFKETLSINQIFLKDALINIQVDKNGVANYNVYVAKTANGNEADSSSTNLNIENIKIEKSHLVYNDQSLPMFVNARGFNYNGKGDLSKAIFDLQTKLAVDSLDFYYDGEAYLLSKKIQAELLTKINTNSLAFIFERNNLMINQLPVKFKGKFEFLSNGYDLDFKLQSRETDLHHLVTALPPGYLQWLNETEVKGTGNIGMALTGKYIAASHTMPALALKLNIRDGFIAYRKAPKPLNNLHLDLRVSVPNLDPEKLKFRLDSLHFNVDKDHFDATVRVDGFRQPSIFAKIDTRLDLQQWQQATGYQGFDLNGQYALNLLANGKYATSIVKKGIRKTDTIISSVPQFSLKSSFTNGSIKHQLLPKSIHDISFNLNASLANHQYKNIHFSLDNFHVQIEKSFLKGFLKFGHKGNFEIDANIESVLQLADIQKAIPMDSLSMAGDLHINVKSNGKYLPAKKQFPVTKALIALDNGQLLTKFYPNPIEKIKVEAAVTDHDGTFKNLLVDIKPISFLFEGQAFWFKANLQNFENMKYDISSKGTLDIGKIYQVFALKGLDVKGKIQTDLKLTGLQSDATNGNFNKLMNKGMLNVKDITLSSDLFPKPLQIHTGKFKFNQDKMLFEIFQASYGSTTLELNGALSNVINYALESKTPLKGQFDFKSQQVFVDELMAFSAESPNQSSATAVKNAGVILIPGNLDLKLTASAKNVNYQGLDLKDFSGQLNLNKGKLELTEAQFKLIDAPVLMRATYGSINPEQAHFDYHIEAQDFDIKKAYQDIKLFRDMATAAASAQGIVSLNYDLSGKLDANMGPVYPSLKGGGVLSVKQVKMKGFKLFNEVGKKTDHTGINDPELSKIDIKTTISNNIITLERTKMKVAGFRPRLEGQVNFDGQLNLKFRLGLPPFGILGIPMTITGTQENPKIRLGQGKQEDELEEIEDSTEETSASLP